MCIISSFLSPLKIVKYGPTISFWHKRKFIIKNLREFLKKNYLPPFKNVMEIDKSVTSIPKLKNFEHFDFEFKKKESGKK